MRLDWKSVAKYNQTCTSLRCTGLFGVHRKAGSGINSLLSGIAEGAAKFHQTVLSGEPTAPAPTVGDVWPEPTVTRPHRTGRCAPDSVRCAKGTEGSMVGFAREGKKLGIVHLRWCTGLSGAPTVRTQELPTKWRSNGS
jgi:hypothetical protein